MAATGEGPTTDAKEPETAPLAPPSSPTQYEFQPSENRLIRDLAWKMHFVGLFVISLGLLTIAIGALIRHVGPIISGTVYALLGLWTQRASTSFKSIVDTKGKDVTHLIRALEDLRKLYSLQYWLCIICLGLALAVIAWVAMNRPEYSSFRL